MPYAHAFASNVLRVAYELAGDRGSVPIVELEAAIGLRAPRAFRRALAEAHEAGELHLVSWPETGRRGWIRAGGDLVCRVSVL